MELAVKIDRQPSLHEVILNDFDGAVSNFLHSLSTIDISPQVLSSIFKRVSTAEVISEKNWKTISQELEIDLSSLQYHCLPSMNFKSIFETPTFIALDKEIGFSKYGANSETTFTAYCKDRLGKSKAGWASYIIRGYSNITSEAVNRFAHEIHDKLSGKSDIKFDQFFPAEYWNREDSLPDLSAVSKEPVVITNLTNEDLNTTFFPNYEQEEIKKEITDVINMANPRLSEEQHSVLLLRLKGNSFLDIARIKRIEKQAAHQTMHRALKKFPKKIALAIRNATNKA